MMDTQDLVTPPLIKQNTSRTVLRAVLHNSPISRAELARVTGLSKQTMSEVVRELEEDGWLRMTGRTQGNIGRSAVTYELESRRAFLIGIDVGGTKMHAAIADLTGAVVDELMEETDSRGGSHVIDQIVRLSQRLADNAAIDRKAVKVGAVGIPGAVSPRTKLVSMMPNISGLAGTNLEAILKKQLGYEVIVENDVNMAAKGEQWLGQGRTIDNFVLVALGTGIGMGIVNDGRLVRGAKGAAGEISTLPIGGDPYDSRTYAAGALESAIGSIAISARYEGLGGTPGLTVRELFDRHDDPLVAIVIDEVARVLATALQAISAVVDPETIIFGGSVGARNELVGRVTHHLERCMPTPVPCTISVLGSQAALFGAIISSLERFQEMLLGMSGGALDYMPIRYLEKSA